MRIVRWLSVPVVASGALVALYTLHLRRARQLLVRTPPETLILPDPRSIEGDLHLEGVPNARDLGGYRTVDGQRVRRGMIYRSGDLSEATDHDLERLQALDVRLVLDLRHAQEAGEAPDRLPTGAAYARLPLASLPNPLRQLRALVVNLRHLETLKLQMYHDVVLQTGASRLGILLRQLAEDDRALPVLIHCTAGKDRTGVACALILSALGVPDEVVFADYSLSNRYFDSFVASTDRQAQSLARIGLVTGDLHPLMLADPSTLRSVFSHLRLVFGSIEGYLQERAGVSHSTIVRLRARLLEPDDA